MKELRYMWFIFRRRITRSIEARGHIDSGRPLDAASGTIHELIAHKEQESL